MAVCRALVALIVILLASAGAVADARATDFHVTKTGDSADGVCDSDCSLREAVIAANAAVGADTIVIPAGTYTLTIAGSREDAGATGDLDLRDDTTITGAGAGSTTIDGGGASGLDDRLLEVLQNPAGGGLPLIPAVSVSGVTLTGGRAPGDGGAANSLGNLALDHVAITGNVASGEGGAVAENGGGTTLVAVRDSVVSANQAAAGGAFVDLGGASSPTQDAGITIERTTVSGNRAVGSAGRTYGGAIAEDGGGDIHIRDSLLSGNSVEAGQAFGGAIATNGAGREIIANTTISGNVVTGDESSGGGLAEEGTSAVSFTNVTIAGNRAEGTGTTPAHMAGNVVLNGGGTTPIQNTIVTGGAPANCAVLAGSKFQSGGHDIDSDSSCGLAGPADKAGVDPLIGTLSDNGGPTRTHRLLPGSPAIDAADNTLCPPTDQRGVARPQPAGGTCDIGAFERLVDDLAIAQVVAQPSVPPGQPLSFTITVTNNGPSDAPAVVITDQLPAGLTLASITPSAGSCTQSPAPSCAIGTLASGAAAHVTVVASGGAGDYDNVARVAQGPLAEDLQPGNDVSSAHATVAVPVIPPAPTRGVDFNASAVSGTVLVSVPQRAATQRGFAGRPVARVAAAISPPRGYTPFRRLGKDDNIPVGSILDATKGASRITMAINGKSTRFQAGLFSKGVFRTSQRKSSALTTTTMMGGGNFKRDCSTKGRVRAAARRPSRRLFANVHGRFRTRGRNSAATVRGTRYLVKDSCRGTLTSVKRGVVVVRDFRLRKNKVVRAGHSYFARASRTRHVGHLRPLAP